MYITTRLLLSSHPSEGISSILGDPYITNRYDLFMNHDSEIQYDFNCHKATVTIWSVKSDIQEMAPS